MSAPPPDLTLRTRTLHALKWNFLGAGVRVVSQLAIGVLLARLLGPGPFGVAAVAWVVIGIAGLFADFGFSAALIQRESLRRDDIRFAFTCQILLGVGLLGVGVLGAEAISGYFREPEAVAPLRAMFLVFVLQSVGLTPAALLRRALDFKRLQQVAIGSYFAGYLAVGLPLALAGSGVWALVAAALVQAGAASAAYAFIGRSDLGWSIRPSDRTFLPFGTRVILANLTSWSIMNVDSVAIGRSLGLVDLGYYNRAMGLVSAPISALVSGLQGVLFSSGSRLQLEPDKLRRLFVASSAAMALLTLPLFGSVALVAETVTLSLYGPAWHAAAAVMAPLALVMVMNAMLCLVGPLLMSMNLVGRELRAQLIVLVVMAPALYLAAQDSLRLVGWVMLAVYSLRWALLTNALLAAVAGSWVGLLGNLKWPLVLGCTVALPVFVVDRASSELIASYAARLMLLVATGLLATAVGLRALGPRLMSGELGLLLRDHVTRQPALRRLLNLRR